MKTFLTFIIVLAAFVASAQERNIREATAAEMAAGTASLPAVVTPRRMGPSSSYYADTNALAFANAAGITDLGARNDLVGFVNELRQGGVWSNLVDAVVFYPRFNPQAGKTLFGRTMLITNASYYKWGVSLTNGTTAIWISGLPDCRTNSQVYSWHVAPGLNPLGLVGSTPQRYFGGVANIIADQSIYFSANGVLDAGIRIRVAGVENATAGNNGQPSWMLGPTVPGYNFNGYLNERATAGNPLTGCINYDGSSLSMYFDRQWMKLDYNNPTFSTNYFLAGLQISAPLTNWCIGVDYKPTSAIMGTSQADCRAALLFNRALSFTDYQCAYRALRWLDPDDADIYLLGDSTVSLNGYNSASITNSIAAQFREAIEKNTNAINLHDWAYGGDAWGHWTPLFGTDSAYTNFTYQLSAAWSPLGKVKRRTAYAKMGINDAYGSWGAYMITNCMWLNAYCTSNGVAFVPFTINMTALNGTVYPQNATGEAFRTNFNNSLSTNLAVYAGVLAVDQLYTLNTVNTNNGYTWDGTHLMGTNGWIINSYIVGLLRGITPAPQVPRVFP